MSSLLDIVMLQCGLSDLTVRCIASIRLTHFDHRIILVDNGSPAHDLDVARGWLRSNDILISNTENLGFAKAVNQGLTKAKAPYVCIQNNDTIMYMPGYGRMIEHLQSDPRLGIVGPMTNNADTVQRGSADPDGGIHYTDGLVAFFCCILPKRVVDDVGRLSEEYGLGYGEDDDYCIRLRKSGYKLGIARDVYVHHDHHATYLHTIGVDGIEAEGQQGLSKLREKYGAVA